MTDEGFQPDFPAEAQQQLAGIRPETDHSLRDLTGLLWSSIDNDDSRDLDQIEWAERVAGGIRVLVGVADVDSAVPKGTPLDRHAAREATTVYAAVRTFPMLPEQLSTDMTSLNENQDRAAVVMEFLVAADGTVSAHSVYRAMVRNKAQLTYNAVGAWLEGTAAPPAKVAASAELQAQLKLQDEAAGELRKNRDNLGALSFDRIEPEPVIRNGNVTEITAAIAPRT
jgi:exoribonuclease-2